MNKNLSILFIVLLFAAGCATRKFTPVYYQDHERSLLEMKTVYQRLYNQRPFSLEFRDKKFTRLAIEIITDSIKYIYRFDMDTEKTRLEDTLKKYHFDPAGLSTLISSMQMNQCTWLTNLDYYENRNQKRLVFMSIRHKDFVVKHKGEQYFTLACFDEPQYYDEKKRLLDGVDRKSIRSINGEVFYMINERVFYAFTGHFR